MDTSHCLCLSPSSVPCPCPGSPSSVPCPCLDTSNQPPLSPLSRTVVTDKSTRFCPTDTAEGTRIGCYSDQHSGITYAVLLICFTEIFTFTISLCLCFEMNAMLSDRGKSLAQDTPMHNPLARWQLNSPREPQARSHPAGTTLRPKFRTQN